MSLKPIKQINAIHANDPEWIIELWLAIHGGDPGPDGRVSAQKVNEAATQVIKAVSVHLDAGKRKAVTAALG